MLAKLILGTAQFGMDYGVHNPKGKIPKSEVFDVLHHAFHNGIQYLDTAPVYGVAQEIIGEFHRAFPQILFKVITKIPSNYPVDRLEKLVDSFLFEMNIDCIHILHFHSINDYISNEKTKLFEIFNLLKKTGKVKCFGVSIYENTEAELLDRTLIDVVQLPFNLLDNINLRGRLVEKLKSQQYEVHARSIFLQGLFFAKPENIKSPEIADALVKLRSVCRLLHCNMLQLALNYCLAQKNIDNFIIGVDSIEHLKSNISVVCNPLEKNIMAPINDIVISDSSQLNPNKWRVR